MKKTRIITIIGARPQFIKAAVVSRAIRTIYPDRITEKIIHSGQHYDDNMSRVFFDEMEIPEPDFNLEVGSGSHAYQTAEIILRSEEILKEEKPDIVMVYGDTNTTLAGGLAAAKLHIPVAHVEAGLRSFKKSMPEEINRIVCDHLSTYLFSPTRTGFENLLHEGFNPDAQPPFSPDHPGIYQCGDVMYDNALYYGKIAEQRSDILRKLDIENTGFILFTLHRDLNTDVPERLNAIMGALNDISLEKEACLVLPLHPRTRKMLPLAMDEKLLSVIESNRFFRVIDPVSYFDMIMLEKNCRMVITDSGGVQKEAYFFRKPCLVLRGESEWKELIGLGAAMTVDADPLRIKQGFEAFYNHPPVNFPEIFGDGRASEFIPGEFV